MFIRADGNSKIGMGHLMRTMSIAFKLKELTEVIYLCAGEVSAETVRERGLEALVLGTEPFSTDEANKICELLSDKDISDRVLLIDSYLFDEAYLEKLIPKIKIVLMDDMADVAYPCNMLINYNTYADADEYIKLYKASGNRLPELVLGGEYIPLRDEFVTCDIYTKDIWATSTDSEDIQAQDNYTKDNTKDNTKNNNTKNNNTKDSIDILITTGGSDEHKLSYKIAKALLESISLPENTIHVVAGKFSSATKDLEKLKEEYPNLMVHNNVRAMAELMSKCTLAISAGGSTCYELCAMGCPFTVFTYATNQIRLADSMVRNNAALKGGDIKSEADEEAVIGNIVTETKRLIEDKDIRDTLIDNERKLVNSAGAKALAKKIYEIMEGNT